MNKEEGFRHKLEMEDDDGGLEPGFYVRWEIMDDGELKLEDKIILSMAISYTSNGQEFYMSNQVLSRKLSVCLRTVNNSIKTLAMLGYIKTFHKFPRDSNRMVGRTIEPYGRYMVKVKRDHNYSYKEYKFTI